MTEPIPKKVLEMMRLRTKRNVATCLVDALAKSDEDISTIEARLGENRGFFMDYFNGLLYGTDTDLDLFIDMCTGIGFQLELTHERIVGLERYIAIEREAEKSQDIEDTIDLEED